jgi:hypothetical protein
MYLQLGIVLLQKVGWSRKVIVEVGGGDILSFFF